MLPTLVNLDLTNCEMEEQAILRLFSLPMPRLKSVAMSQPSEFGILSQLGKVAPQLESLELHINPAQPLIEPDMVSVAQCLPHLVNVSLWSLGSMSFETLEVALSTWANLKSILIGVWKEGCLNLTSDDLCEIRRQFPQVELRCFNGSRFESLRYNLSSCDEVALHINHISINLEVDDCGDGDVTIEPIVFIDNVPIWTNEAPASL